MGGLVAWVVERTDAPGGSLFHALALLSFAIPGLLTAMAWIFVLSPNIGWVNALLKSVVRAEGGAVQHLHHGRHDLGAVEPLFPARLSGARPGAARARRAHGGGGAGLRRALLAGDAEDHAAAVAAGDPVDGAAAVHARHVVLRGAAADRPAGAHRRVHHRHPGAPPRARRRNSASPARSASRCSCICIVAVFFYRRATRNAEAFATITGKGYMPTRIELRHWRWPVSIAIGLMFAISLGLPLLTLVWQSFYRNLAQPFVGSTGAGDAGELRVHPELSDLRRRGEDQRAARRHGGDHRRRAHLRDGLDRAARRCRAPAGCSIRSPSRRSRSRT